MCFTSNPSLFCTILALRVTRYYSFDSYLRSSENIRKAYSRYCGYFFGLAFSFSCCYCQFPLHQSGSPKWKGNYETHLIGAAYSIWPTINWPIHGFNNYRKIMIRRLWNSLLRVAGRAILYLNRFLSCRRDLEWLNSIGVGINFCETDQWSSFQSAYRSHFS